MTPPNKSAFVQKLTASAQKHAEELFEQNERLKSLVASLEEKQTQISEELSSLREERDALRAERVKLKHVLDEALAQNRRDIERSSLVEQQCTSLANLYVATFKLHGSLERPDVLAAISEIVVNLVGCEHFGVFERFGEELKLIGEFPAHPSPVQLLPAETGFVADIFRASGPWIAGRDPQPASNVPDGVTAVIPLRLGSDLTGAVVLFTLLPQKGGSFGDVDIELMDLLTAHAATALFASRT
ncbi:MAG: GAF domain-containing protein [Vicinamibacteria bacterium]|nr:GAF domain-containing protein [Vicinamibacteria bacterium]